MDYRTLRNIDLNLLIVLDVLLQERSVTIAAKKLGRTQSAVSHALSRLRSTFEDKLLVRVGGSMEPTPRAKNLQKDLQRLLGSLRRFMDDTDQFSPKESTRTFVLALPDNLSPILGPLLMRFEHEAPQASILVQTVDSSLLVDMGKGINIRILPTHISLPIGLQRSDLGACQWKTFVRKDHPILEHWDLDSWLQHPHIRFIDFDKTRDGLESTVQELGKKRTFKATVDSFAMGLSMIEHSNCLFTCLSAGEETLNPNIIARTIPFEVQEVHYGMVFSEALEQDSAKKWFEELIRVSFPNTTTI